MIGRHANTRQMREKETEEWKVNGPVRDQIFENTIQCKIINQTVSFDDVT